MKLICSLAFALLVFTTTVAQAQQKVELFELSNRQASELVSQLKTLYPDQEVIFSADGQRLMVKGPATVVAEVGELARRLDVAPAQLRITVLRHQASQDKVSTGERLSTRARQSQQSVVVQSGETARIEAGVIRRVTSAVAGGDYVGLVAEDTPMTSGFMVQPRALGSNQIELRIISFNDDPARHKAYGSSRDTAAVVTQRRVSPGEWVNLGSAAEAHTAEHQGVTYSTRDSGQTWSIKVDLVP